jgi:hypothetical protein
MKPNYINPIQDGNININTQMGQSYSEAPLRFRPRIQKVGGKSNKMGLGGQFEINAPCLK